MTAFKSSSVKAVLAPDRLICTQDCLEKTRGSRWVRVTLGAVGTDLLGRFVRVSPDPPATAVQTAPRPPLPRPSPGGPIHTPAAQTGLVGRQRGREAPLSPAEAAGPAVSPGPRGTRVREDRRAAQGASERPLHSAAVPPETNFFSRSSLARMSSCKHKIPL